MIVVDASAVMLALLSEGEARRRLASESLAVPHLVDSEITNALRSQVIRHHVTPRQAEGVVSAWATMGVRRFGVVGLLGRMWELRDNLTGYDATYVALAEALECALLSADGRLAAAPGPRCPIMVVRG